jgi:sialic acid synthase SpsE
MNAENLEARRVFIIAEAGSNWRMGTPRRDREMAHTLIDIAAEAGADAVKFQTYRSAGLYVPNAGDSDYLAKSGIKQQINEILDDLSMPYEMIGELAAYCDEKKIQFMSTPFSVEDAKAVDPFVKTHKIASYEINHLRLLQWIGATGKPVILSTGAATADDIEYGLQVLHESGAGPITLLQCTASYPAPMDSLNLAAIPQLREKYSVPAGLSDHSRDPVIAPVAAVALGACVIEKHYTIDNRLPGADHPFAILPEELALMVKSIREAEQTLGDGSISLQPAEEELRGFATRSIQAIRDIQPGEMLEEGVNIDVLRPGKRNKGISPRYLDEIVGKNVVNFIRCGDGIVLDDIEP